MGTVSFGDKVRRLFISASLTALTVMLLTAQGIGQGAPGVPDVRVQTYDQAERILRLHGFAIHLLKIDYVSGGASAATSVVIWQRPLPGSQAAPGSVVEVMMRQLPVPKAEHEVLIVELKR